MDAGLQDWTLSFDWKLLTQHKSPKRFLTSWLTSALGGPLHMCLSVSLAGPAHRSCSAQRRHHTYKDSFSRLWGSFANNFKKLIKIQRVIIDLEVWSVWSLKCLKFYRRLFYHGGLRGKLFLAQKVFFVVVAPQLATGTNWHQMQLSIVYISTSVNTSMVKNWRSYLASLHI